MSFLEEHFELLTRTPENAARLKELILQLAVQGKLVLQDPSDEPANVLLEKIKTEKVKLAKEGKIKKDKPLPPITEDEIPYELPKGWVWCRFQKVLDVRDGTHDTPKYFESGFPLITSKNLKNGRIDFTNVKYISKEDHELICQRSRVDEGDILFAMIGTIGNAAIVGRKDEDFSIKNVALFKFYSFNPINNKYLKSYLDFVEKEMSDNAEGGVQSFVSLSLLRKYLFPLPPINEQKRIVDRVESLMAKVKKLEKANADGVLQRRELGKSMLHYLSNAEVSQETLKYWHLIENNFEKVFTDLENVKELRKTCLQLAVKGKLVPQDPNDEPASVLLERIKAKKEKLIKEGKIKKQKPLPPITEDEIPNELPVGWVWCRLGKITQIIAGNSFKSEDFNTIDGVRCIKITNAGVREFIETDDFLPFGFDKKHTDFVVFKGDLIIALTRPYIKSGLKISICPETYNNSLLNQRVAAIKNIYNISSKYIFTFLSTEDVLNNYKVKFEKKGLQPNLKMKDVVEVRIHLPPLNEQKSIVEKVDRLMRLCDRLEEKIKESDEKLGVMMRMVVS